MNPLSAFVLFFVAVILVIIGTYCLFTASAASPCSSCCGKQAVLLSDPAFHLLSGMLYRMKQNAGLANICILSTAVLVMISSTLSLFLGWRTDLRRCIPGRSKSPRRVTRTSRRPASTPPDGRGADGSRPDPGQYVGIYLSEFCRRTAGEILSPWTTATPSPCWEASTALTL